MIPIVVIRVLLLLLFLVFPLLLPLFVLSFCCLEVWAGIFCSKVHDEGCKRGLNAASFPYTIAAKYSVQRCSKNAMMAHYGEHGNVVASHALCPRLGAAAECIHDTTSHDICYLLLQPFHTFHLLLRALVKGNLTAGLAY